MNLKICAPLIAVAVATPVAQAEGLDFTIAGGYAFSGTEGWELEAGAAYEFADRVVVRLSPANIVFFEGDPPEGFYTDTFSNGQSRCRNASNGQFADDVNCQSEIDHEWRGVAEAQLRVNSQLLVGGGGLYTFTSDDIEKEGTWEGFASLSFQVAPHVTVDARGGADYGSVMLRLTM